jgi:tight adherence protein B
MFGLMAVIFACCAIAILAFGAALDSSAGRAQLLRRRLESIDAAASRGKSEEVELLRDELVSDIPALNKVLSHWSRTSQLQRFLNQADLKIRAGKFLLVTACCAMGLCSLAIALSHSNMLAVVGLAFGAALPFAFVLFRRRQRFQKFEATFPEAIELLVRSSRAGHPFTTSLEMMGNELAEPISGEFRQVFEEQKFGLPIRDALLNLAERVPLVDVKFFVTTLMLQRESGGNLAEILDKLAYVIRERFKIQRQVRVYTAQGRLTMMILMALPPGMVVLMSISNPGFIKPLFEHPLGHFLLGLGITLQAIGFVLINKIVNIKV